MFEAYIEEIEKTLFSELPALKDSLSDVREMMAYSLEGGGKRVRPLLCVLFCEAVGGDWKKALPFAAAVEFIHTYSLIHDDLPCMDNDDFRRGKLSSHKQFGEANALLTGDALLTEAFGLIARGAEKTGLSAEACLRAVNTLSVCAGAVGMVGGQYIDLASEGKALSGDTLFLMDALKTGALIEAACVLGCIAGGATEAQIHSAERFAKDLGLAFQIKDDLLEYESDEEDSDERNQKATYISVFGYEKAKDFAMTYTNSAISALDDFGAAAQQLKQLAELLLNRRK